MNDYRCQLLLFAAGLGTRLRPHTNNHPKPVIPLFQIPLGYYALPYLDYVSLTQKVVNTFYLSEQIHQLYQPLQFSFSDEYGYIRGSSGGLKYAEKYFDRNSPLVLMNADEIFFTDQSDFIRKALIQHQQNKALATLVVTDHPEVGQKFGGIWHKDNRVHHIGKNNTNENLIGKHFIGVQIIDPKVMDFITADKEQNIFYDTLVQRLQTDLVQIYEIDCDWYEIGNYTDYAAAKLAIEQKKKSDHMYIKHFNELRRFSKSQLSDLSE